MEVHSLAELRRYLATPEAKIKLIAAPTMPNHKWLYKTRGVEKLQTNAVKLEGGSWLEWRSGAKGFVFRGDEFDCIMNGQVFLTYKIL